MRLALSLAFTMMSAPAAAQVFKCEIGGQIVYRDAPCPTSGKTVEVLRPDESRSKRDFIRESGVNLDGRHFDCTREILQKGFDRPIGTFKVMLICGRPAGVTKDQALSMRSGAEIPYRSPETGMKLIQWVRSDGVKYRFEWLEKENVVKSATLFSSSIGGSKSMEPTSIPKRSVESVRDKIKSKCIGEWPDDYTMQEYCIRKQVEAYNKVYN